MKYLKKLCVNVVFGTDSNLDNFERLRRVEILAKEKGLSVPQLALAWTLKQPLKTVLLASARSADRMKDNVKAFDIDLTEEEISWVDCVK